MKKKYVRNVRLTRFDSASPSLLRRLERILITNPFINRFCTQSAKLALTCMIWPRFVAPYRWQLTRHDMPLANLAPAFNGYKILQLTDLHTGKTRADYLLRVIDQCLQEKPDLIVITGDLIDYRRRALPLIRKILDRLVNAPASLKPRDGIVAIFGNHDYHEYSWRHVGARSAHRTIHRRLLRLVQESGIHLLRNEQHRLPAPAGAGNDLILVGLDEMWTGRADPARAFAGLSPADPILCLQHNPDGLKILQPFPWQFMLCGHSHGGQARFPLVGALYVPMEHPEYLSGTFQFPLLPGQPAALDHRTMFVSRRLGHSTPIRLRCPPEATLFTVKCV